MRDLDETDLEILRLLSENSRRPYSEIADAVGLSPPAVSDRIDRLQEQGIIRQFTIDIDRSKLQYAVPVLVTLQPRPAAVDTVYDLLGDIDRVEHRFQLADGTIKAHINAPQTDVHGWMRDRIPLDRIDAYDIVHLAAHDWTPAVQATEFAVTCAVCDNKVDDQGVTAKIGGDIKAFCCPSCRQQYETRYEQLLEESS